MPIYAPGTQHAFHVAIVPRAPDMIHDLVATVFNDSCADFGGECIQYLIPGGAFPFALATFACAFQGVEDAFGIIDLVDGSRAFGAVASSAAWMVGVALEFFDTTCFLIHISHQTTGGFAVKADGGNDGVVPFDFARPGFGVVFYPVMPAFGRWTRGQVSHGHLFTARCNVVLQRYLGHLSLQFRF